MENHAHDIPHAPSWSLFVGQGGHYLVLASIALLLLASFAWFLSVRKPSLERFGKIGFALGSLCLFGAMAALITLFVKDQFQFAYIFARAETNTDLKYKIAGVWSGQQGSFLLWACCSALFGLLTVRGTGIYRRWYTITFSLFLASLAAILAYETPFNLIPDVIQNGEVLMPTFGQGMTPALQNYWVAIHPPTIFLGFGALTVLFCYAVSAILTGNLVEWISRVRPWALVAMSILGLGLCMGGFWAYETLGWGGFWKWDPVENASFVPWVLLAAFVHGMIVQTTKAKWIGVNLLLAALPFLMFVYGTFLTRSGFLGDTSVHSFAQMDRSALKILVGIMAAGVIGFSWIWLTKGLKLARELTPKPAAEGFTRETAYGAGSLLLAMFGLFTAIGMSVPLMMSLRNQKPKVVEEPLYHQVLVWPFIPIMLLIAIGPFLAWRRSSWKELGRRMVNVVSLTVGITGVSLFLMRKTVWGQALDSAATVNFPMGIQAPLMPWMIALILICVFAAVSNLWRLAEVIRRSPMSVGGFVAHIGVAVVMTGLVVSRGFESKTETVVRRGDAAAALDYTLAFKGMSKENEEEPFRNRDNKVLFDVHRDATERILEVLSPEQRTMIDTIRANDQSLSFSDLRLVSILTHPELSKLLKVTDHQKEHFREIIADAQKKGFEARPGLYYTDGQDGKQVPTVWPHIQRFPSHDLYLTMYAPVFDVFTSPVELKPGESKTVDGGYTLTYKKFTSEGEPGTATAKFGALIEVKHARGTFNAHPQFSVREGRIPDALNDDLLAVIERLDAGSKSIALNLYYQKPLFYIDLYYKPMTSLVWLGTGILTFGGLFSALYRRFRPKNLGLTPPEAEPSEAETYRKEEDALVPTP